MIETQPTQTSQISFFTIIGGVERSGVYMSQERTIPLSRLIQEAGGFSAQASSNVRVIRNGRPRLQLHCHDPATAHDAIYGDDLVVIVPQPEVMSPASANGGSTPPPLRIIPVACLGLAERPVVLPLDPAIRTVEDLNRHLLQSPGLKQHVQVLDPYARPQMSQLVPGTVLLFDARHVDRARLAATREFPPAVPLQPPRFAKQPEPLAAQDLVQSRPENFVVQQPTGPVDVPERAEPAMPQALFAPATTVEINPQPEPPPIELPERPTVAELFSAQLAADDGARQQGPLSATGTPRLITARRAETPTTAEPIDLPAPPEAEPSPVSSGSGSTIGRTLPTAPLPPVGELDRADMSTFDLTDVEFAVAPQPATPDGSGSRIMPALIALGGLVALCFGGTLVWSRWDMQRRSTDFSSSESSPEVAAEEQSRDPIADILDRSLPIIEEPAKVPGNLSLHGEAVGHRRLILHEAHPTLAGMHFGKRAKVSVPVQASAHAQAIPERELRRQIRDAFRPEAPFPDEPRHRPVPNNEDFEMPPKLVPATDASADRPERSRPLVESASVLDRVLRTLDRERRR